MIFPHCFFGGGRRDTNRQTPLQRILILTKVVAYTTKHPSDCFLSRWPSLSFLWSAVKRDQRTEVAFPQRVDLPLLSKQLQQQTKKTVCYNLGAIIAFGNITNYPVLGGPLCS